MAISLLAANNAQSVLAAGISAAATTLTVNTGTGTLFPSPVLGTSFFKLTLIDASTGTLTEIVHVTQRVGDLMTIERGQEGTAARIWSANDLVANMMTAGTLSYLKQDIDGKLPKTGTAAAATKLETARTIGGVSFDGTANINLPGVNAAGNQSTTGNAATATRLATARAIGGVSFDGTANINLPGVNAAGNQSTTGNAATATKLATARTINGVAFDGTANITLPLDLPVGSPVPYPLSAAPTGWLKCNGQTFDTAKYPVLASRYPSGQLPDLRGEFIRGWDDGRKVDVGRNLLSAQGDAIRNMTGTIGQLNDRVTDTDTKGVFSATGYTGADAGLMGGSAGRIVTFDPSTVVPTANENRPRNIAFNYIVRAA